MGIAPVFYSLLKNLRCLSSLFVLLFFVSCNSELAKLSPIRFTPVRLETANAGAFNNMMIYATRTDGSFAFARMYTAAPVIEEEMPIGDYRFYGMTFDGFSNLLCAKTSSYLSGLSNQVTLSFDEVTCADSVFLGSDPALNLDTFPAVTLPFSKVEICDSVEGITAVTDECTDDLVIATRKHSRGHAMGLKATLVTFEKSRGQTTVSSGITMGCLSLPTPSLSLRGSTTVFLSNIYPEGDGATTPFLIRFEFYPGDTSCNTGTPHVIDFPNGLAVNNSSAKKINQSGAERKLYFKVGKDEICKGDNLTSTFAGGEGSINSPKLICNETQFYNIFPNNSNVVDYSTRAMRSYKLMSNIDLSDNPVIGGGFNPDWAACAGVGSNFMPIGFTYDGSVCAPTGVNLINFDGDGHFIKGLKIVNTELAEPTGFYSRILYNFAESEIKRLTLIDPEISGPARMGTLAGLSTRVKFTDINIQSATLNAPTSSFVGGIAGESYGDTVNSVTVSDISITAQNQVGGIFGQTAMDAITTNIFDSYVSGTIVAGNYVGGMVGNMNAGGAGTLSVLKRSRFIGNITSGTHTGGLLGQATTTRISNSYARADFTNTAVTNVRFGGIVGIMLSNTSPLDPSGVFSSYITGDLVQACTLFPATSCMMGTIIGDHDGTFTAANFDTAVYPAGLALTATTLGVRGKSQPDPSFMLASPGWMIVAWNDWLTYFLPVHWKFSDTDYPRLVGEPIE